MVETANPVVVPARVLVLDDERSLLPLLDRFLRRQGFEPVCHYDAAEALAAFRSAEPAFDLVMTDLTLEGASGEDVAREVLAADPTVRVLLMSGYPYTSDHLSDEERARVGFLQKPFLPTQIAEAVQKLRKPTPIAPVEEPVALPEELAAAPEIAAEMPPVLIDPAPAGDEPPPLREDTPPQP